MAKKQFMMRVLTPTKKVLEQPVEYAVLPTTEGQMGVLPGHLPCAAVLGYGLLQLHTGGEEQRLYVMGGMASVQADGVTVLSEMAGGAQEVEQALRSLEKAKEERKQEELQSSVEIQRAEVALRNALVHLDVSSYSVLSSMRDWNHDEEAKP